MWTRKQLKEKGKHAFNRNYWKSVLVSLIALMVLGGAIGGSGGSLNGFGSFGASSAASNAANYMVGEQDDVDDVIEFSEEDILDRDENDPITWDDEDDSIAWDDEDGFITFDSDDPEIRDFLEEGPMALLRSGFGIAMLIIFAIVFLIILAVAILIGAFLGNPLTVGCARFFIRNLNTEAEVKELAYGYDHSYLNIVKTIFLKELYTFLWALLLIIPGIIKSYEYRMIPYILAEHPEMPTKDVFAKSKAMMSGQKWKAFVLDLSFIGWSILSALTLGLLGIFYVNPYRNMTYAALYEALEYGPDDAGMTEGSFPRDAITDKSEDSSWTNETTY